MIGDEAILKLWHAAQKYPTADVPAGFIKDTDNWEGTATADLFEALQDFALYPKGMDAEVDDFLADMKRGQDI